MSTPWTTITAGLDWQDKDFINELLLGYHERRRACYILNGSLDYPVDAGFDIQLVNFWAGIQSGLEGCIGDPGIYAKPWDYFYIDDTLYPYTGRSELPALAKADWFTRADMTYSGGWRRAKNWDPSTNDWTDPADPMYFAHGIIQAGDIIGPWIFEDLQNAMTELKYTGGQGGIGEEGAPGLRDKTGITTSDPDCATNLTANRAAWNAAPWVPNAGSFFYSCYRHSLLDGQWLQIGRSQSKCNTYRNDALGAIENDYDWNVYLIPGPDYTFQDIDNLGMVDGKLYSDQSGTGANNWNFTTPNLCCNGITTYPGDVAPAWACPIADFDGGVYIIYTGARWVYKWQFTNA